MDSIKTLSTRIAPLMIVAALGGLMSACGSDRGIEMADSLGKGGELISPEQSAQRVASAAPTIETPASGQADLTQTTQQAQAGETVSSQAPIVQNPTQTSAPAAPAQSVVTSAPTATMATGRVALSWTPPTENTDGSALSNLSGYRVYFGTRADALTQSVQITNPGLTAYVIENLPQGTTYFAVAAYNASGAESALSGVGSKTIS
jgi:hypothetical protein